MILITTEITKIASPTQKSPIANHALLHFGFSGSSLNGNKS
jgi:hypothetical protein